MAKPKTPQELAAEQAYFRKIDVTPGDMKTAAEIIAEVPEFKGMGKYSLGLGSGASVAPFSIPATGKTANVSTGLTTDLNNLYTAVTVTAGINILNTAYAGGADPTGTADSTTAIQTAINAAAVYGATVFCPAGTYKLTAALQIPQNAHRGTSIHGEGQSVTIFKPAAGANYNAIQTQITPSSGTGGYTYKGLKFSDFTIDCSLMTGTTNGAGNGLYLFGGIECYIQRIYVTGCPNWGIVLDSTAANDAYWSWVEDCLIDLCAGGILAGYNTACTIVGCVIPNFLNTAAATQPQYTGPLSNVTNAIFSGSQASRIFNNVIGNGGATSETLRTSNIENLIIGNYFPSNAGSGRTIHNAANTNTIMGNVFESPVGGASNAAIVPGSGDVYIGNVFKNAGAAMTYAISNSVANVVVMGNTLVAGTSGVVNTNGNVWYVSGNVGYNPVGKIGSPPAVPLTTVNATNTTGVDCMVIVTLSGSGGATTISIGGNSTGITSSVASTVLAPVFVAAGQTISIAYTNAPTWTWWGS